MQFNLKGLFSKTEKKRTLIIVGLGNPGEKYKDNYHNMGYKVLDVLAQKTDNKIKRAQCSSLTASFCVGNLRIILAKPITYMNLSGQAVKSLMCKFNAEIEDIVIVYDDVDIPRFSIRARQNGSAGTHNGMKNIIEVLSNNNLKRIRIGVGKEDEQLKDYVLSNIKKDDEKAFNSCFEKVAMALMQYFNDSDFEKLMREINSYQGNK